MRGIVASLLLANLLLAGLGMAGVLDTQTDARARFDPEVPGFRGRLLELADDVIEPDPFPLLPATGSCFIAEGFADAGSAGQAARRWLAQGREVTLLRRRQSGEVSGFQVVTPSMTTRDERVRTQQSLASLGFEAHLVAAGENAERVSLGVFRDTQAANQLLERLQAAGFDAEVSEVHDDSWQHAVAGPLAAMPAVLEVERTTATTERLSCAEIAAAWSQH